jgi:hypothetical protein
MKLFEEFRIYENMWDEPIADDVDFADAEPKERQRKRPSDTHPYDPNMKIPARFYGRYFDLANPESAIDYLKRSIRGYLPTIRKCLRDYVYSKELENCITEVNRIVDATLKTIRVKGFNDVADKVKREIDTVVEPINTKFQTLKKANIPAKPQISQDIIDKFHKQNIRILSLIYKYTDLHKSGKANLNDLLKQLDENRIANPIQAERDFIGI